MVKVPQKWLVYCYRWFIMDDLDWFRGYPHLKKPPHESHVTLQRRMKRGSPVSVIHQALSLRNFKSPRLSDHNWNLVQQGTRMNIGNRKKRMNIGNRKKIMDDSYLWSWMKPLIYHGMRPIGTINGLWSHWNPISGKPQSIYGTTSGWIRQVCVLEIGWSFLVD